MSPWNYGVLSVFSVRRRMLLNRFKKVSLVTYEDFRGTLALLDKEIFTRYSRLFVVHNVNDRESIRGNHAHRVSSQFLICLKGEIEVELFDGKTTTTIKLTQIGDSVEVAPLIWSWQTYSKDSLLLVLTDTDYSESEYINSMREFLELVR